jgi:hypothetical protein
MSDYCRLVCMGLVPDYGCQGHCDGPVMTQANLPRAPYVAEPSGQCSTGWTYDPAKGWSCGGVVTPIGSSQTATASASSTGGTADMAVSAKVSNYSRPGNPLRSGDTFLVEVTGPPNQPVTVRATQNGKDLGETAYGSTDSSGRFRLTGSLTDAHTGNWVEVWSVGGRPAPGVSFSVGPAVSSTVSSGDKASGDKASEGGDRGDAGATTGGSGGGAGGGSGAGFLSGVNPWVLVAVAAGAFLLVKK